MKNKHKISTKDITVVVQGPVQTFNAREQEFGITRKCLDSVRYFLPGAKIILSTWHNQDLTDLDYDQLVLCDDPGSNVRAYNVDGTPQTFNNNRQIVSTLSGLEQVTTPYAMKLRSDNYLISDAFLHLQQDFPKRCEQDRFFHEKVVVINTFTRRYAKGVPVVFHMSDFFYFGRTDDVIACWNIPLIDDFIVTKDCPYNIGFPDYSIDCTQMLFVRAMRKFDSQFTLNGLLDNNPEKQIFSDRCFANNFVIAEPQQVGVGLCRKFAEKARVSRTKGKVAHWQFKEWQQLYKKYCDPSFVIQYSMWERCKLFLQRCLYVFPARIENKRRLQQRQKKVAFNNK
ncbi:WavE lipopolysaccharide synthesis [Photobacterium malacitanum]|uniref:WavE lipopolysaccharide synthesis n=1 Tax=Photobacterium malacitanum TaxID=2204294 RepID=A0A1Y6MMG1_9GAMM|nr:WavE lipopolysaccharide synthesis family protein [Photobacterium malacitanum]SMY36988.1 WavE lipopolysaccharide synthesis [Photobacterium malacitanum]